MASDTYRVLSVRRLSDLVGRELRALWARPWFRLGFILRLVMSALLVPAIQSRWFIPFVAQSLTTLDPYSAWIDSHHDARAWPYGPVMTFAHLPTALLGLMGAPLALQATAFSLVLMAADLLILICLRDLVGIAGRDLVSKLWWLCPASLIISYWHGQTDVVPLGILMLALVAFRDRRWRSAGILTGLSIAAKLTMAVAPAFFVIWLGMSRRYWGSLRQVFLPMFAIPAATYGIMLGSPGAFAMVFGNPIAEQAAATTIDFHGESVMVLPALLLGLFYVAARARRLGYSLMLGILGLSFFLMAVVVAVAPGWWLWALPFLVLYAAKSERAEARVGVWIYSGLLGTQTILQASGAEGVGFSIPSIAVPEVVESANITLVVAIGVVLAVSMFRHILAENDPYGLAVRPIALGIAGDSGTGKDTLSRALARIFGEREVVAVSGDDYHKWERGSPMWQVWTHHNPAANHLRQFREDVRALCQGGAIQCRFYDHETGRFEPRRSKSYNDIVLVSGLHALYGPELLNLLDVRVFLEMDEGLRRYLKVARDTTERKQSEASILASVERRMPDKLRYIDPQSQRADLVLRLEPAEPASGDTQTLPVLRLVASVRHSLRLEELSRLLNVFCWCESHVEQVDGSGESVFSFEGEDVTGSDIEEIARLLISHHEELLALRPRFEDGVTGVMQLLVLMQIEANRLAHNRMGYRV